ncbi:MAG: hypothetical protein WBM83_03290 [Flavobacteriaceae bacterium]
MKPYKKVVSTLAIILALFLVFALWYKNEYSMETVEAYEINSSNLEKTLLIATQGSEFKNAVTQGLVNHYGSGDVYIKVIDVATLNNVNPSDYDAILVIHTWEYEKPPTVVAAFIERTASDRDKIVVMTTSGQGTSKMEGVDAITGESVLDDAPRIADEIIIRLAPIL